MRKHNVAYILIGIITPLIFNFLSSSSSHYSISSAETTLFFQRKPVGTMLK